MIIIRNPSASSLSFNSFSYCLFQMAYSTRSYSLLSVSSSYSLILRPFKILISFLRTFSLILIIFPLSHGCFSCFILLAHPPTLSFCLIFLPHDLATSFLSHSKTSSTCIIRMHYCFFLLLDFCCLSLVSIYLATYLSSYKNTLYSIINLSLALFLSLIICNLPFSFYKAAS